MKKRSSTKGRGLIFPVDNWREIIIVDDDKIENDIWSFRIEFPSDIVAHLNDISERLLELIDTKQIDRLAFLEAFHSSIIASHLAEKMESGDYDTAELVMLAIKLGELSTIAKHRSAEHEYASGVNMKEASKRASQAVTKQKPSKAALERVLSKLRKIHPKETRVVIEAGKHFGVGKSTVYKWKSQLGIS